MANFCSKCGAKIDSNAKFCARCGQPVSAPAGRTAAQRPSQPQGASQRTLNPQGASQRTLNPQGAPQRPSQPQSAAQRNLYPQGAAPGAGVQQPYYRQPAAPSYQNPPAKKSSAGLILMIIAIALFVILLVQLAIAGFVRPGWFKADAGSTQYVAAVESENVGEILPDGTEAAVF